MYPIFFFSTAFIFCSTLFSLSAQTPPKGEIIIIRQTGKLKSAEKCVLSIGDSVLTEISNNSVEIFELEQGKHTLQVSIGKGKRLPKSLSVEVHAGELIFLKCKLFQQSRNKIIPSQGFYFVLEKIHPGLFPKMLQQDIVQESLKEHLYNKWLIKHGLRQK